MLKRVGLGMLGLIVVLVLVVSGVHWAVGLGGIGTVRGPGQVTNTALPRAIALERKAARLSAATHEVRESGRQILFGDLHVHTTYSNDAFFFSLPLMQGEGAHPPADACDFARFCSALDFWSINDHAELITPRQWAETTDTIRQCNAVGGDSEDPDVVAFLGWEWTQMGQTPETHYGHKNIVIREIDEGDVPKRPIAAERGLLSQLVLGWPDPMRTAMGVLEWSLGQDVNEYADFHLYAREAAATLACPPGTDPNDAGPQCIEYAPTPSDLFEKLEAWGGDSLVIPHGLAWGIHSPPNASVDNQLEPGQHDPTRQRLLEVYSGHGSSEQWRGFEHVGVDENGAATCPAPSEDFEACCWRAGELIRDRCQGVSDEICEGRVEAARQTFISMAYDPRRYRVVPGATTEDWLDCGQLEGFLPASTYRPKLSAQYALARRPSTNRNDQASLRVGLVGSSDNHYARAGTGYKEFGLHGMSDARAARTDLQLLGGAEPPARTPKPRTRAELDALSPIGPSPGNERGNSFLYTGGLAAVHAASRDRDGIWSALERREVYATSGDRILLWFDLETDDGRHPMGSVAQIQGTPSFRVRAVGAFEQRPGCPEYSQQALSPARLERLCKGECYHPGDRRKPMSRIEVVRIRPQIRPDEPLDDLIEDPWKTLPCPANADGCEVSFDDPEFGASGRETLYYVRALQTPSKAVNGDNLRCTRDAAGQCIDTRPCFANGPQASPDDCLGEVHERAWSSPIFLLPN